MCLLLNENVYTLLVTNNRETLIQNEFNSTVLN